jgi:hypothetical protein
MLLTLFTAGATNTQSSILGIFFVYKEVIVNNILWIERDWCGHLIWSFLKFCGAEIYEQESYFTRVTKYN